MDYFFHADTTKYRKRLKGTIIIVLVPLFGICVFCAVNILLNLSSSAAHGFCQLMLAVIVGCVCVGIAAAFIACYLTYKQIRRHSRFTYLDILPDGFVFSLYAGEYRRYTDQIIQRKLYYVPFSGLEEIIRDGKNSPCTIKFRGEVRYFLCETDRLGYHVDEENHLQFDSAELNSRGFELLDSLEISGWFGSTKRLERSLRYFLEEYNSAPEKKPFNIAEHIPTRKKKRPTTSNPMLEAPSYDRNWK